jgi:sugar lactone lactonase YvrE
MKRTAPTPLNDIVATLGEGPTWAPAENALYWIDLIARQVLRHNFATGATRVYPVSGLPAAIALRQGGLLVAYRNGFAHLDTENGDEARIDASIDFSQERFNDGACDSRGRFFVGTMDKRMSEAVGGLWRVDPDMTITRLAGGVCLANGIAWSPDDTTLYFCDSRPGVVRAYDYDVESGSIANERVHISFEGMAAHPDGCAMDAEGCLWIAEMGAGSIGRYDPSGCRIGGIEFPVSRVTSLAFCGRDLTTLCVTTMRNGLSPDELERQPLAGRTFVVEMDVVGLPVGGFSG